MRIWIITVGWILALASQSVLAATTNKSPVLHFGSGAELLVDDWMVQSLHGASLRMHPPTPHEVVFHFDAPWEGPECGYVTVLKDGKDYRMYYRGGGESTEEVTCMAESADGINWQRPKLGLFDFKGSKENNIIWKGQRRAYAESHNFTPFIDVNPAAKAEERYKAVAFTKYQDEKGENQRALAALDSADGIHWQKLRAEPVIKKGGFDSQNVAFWDAPQHRYACYYREGRNGIRSVRRTVSEDFVNWSEPEWLDFGDTPAEQFYTSGIASYMANPQLYLGFPMRFVPERKAIGAEGCPVDALSDGVMISSHDGLHFVRPFMEAFIRPGLDPKNWGNGHGNNTPAWGLLPTSADEISIYWSEHFGADYTGKTGKLAPGRAPQLRRGVVRRDGFASVNAGFGGGEFLTKPLIFVGRKLVLNYSTSAVGSVRVEILDQTGTPMPGFTMADCAEIYGDEIERVVQWKGNSDLSVLSGRTVQLRVALKDADLFSVRFIP